MHRSVMNWGARCLVSISDLNYPILEVGSRNVNGSLRSIYEVIPFFPPPLYVGVDLELGRGVDAIANGARLPYPSGTFGLVICTEVLEHDPAFWLTMGEIWRVLRNSGQLILTARGLGFPRHDWPADYWRFTVDAFRELSDRFGFLTLGIEEDPQFPGVLGHFVKLR